MSDRDKITDRTVNLGMVSNIMLSILKTAVGVFGHSPALLADGINSTSDVVYYIVVKIFMHQAKKPADSEHPFGHRQLESISAIVVGAFILTTGIAIFWESISKVYDILSSQVEGRAAVPLAMYIALGTFLLKLFLFTYTRKNYRHTKNPTLKALANDHFNDIMAAIAVIAGLVMGRLGYYWMDPAAGAIVAVYIIKTGVEIIMDSSRDLMDSIPDDDFRREVRSLVGQVEGVKSIEEMGVHRFGPYYTIDMTIGVDGAISVDEGNRISHRVEELLLGHFSSGLRRVHIHFHPHQGSSHDG
jgi:cation diffusion facilitator family transporter